MIKPGPPPPVYWSLHSCTESVISQVIADAFSVHVNACVYGCRAVASWIKFMDFALSHSLLYLFELIAHHPALTAGSFSFRKFVYNKPWEK